MLEEGDIRTVATEIFADALGTERFENLDVASGSNHAGDPSFFVTLFFKPGTDPRDIEALSSAHAALRRRLLELNEERFPYLRYRYPGDEVLVGEDDPGPA